MDSFKALLIEERDGKVVSGLVRMDESRLDAGSVTIRVAYSSINFKDALAATGSGKIIRVEISTDGGVSWRDAELQSPVFSKALTRFRAPWVWTGQPAVLHSRSTDETGYIQPTRDVLVAARGLKEGPDGFNHFHGITPWKVDADGKVTHV